MKPLEISLFEDQATARPGTSNFSDDSEADRFGSGIDTISSRFRQRFRQLADEAAQAAEEEARVLRVVAATHGAEMLAAASEWMYVSTDSRLAPTKCWYRASTSEYFWGNDPPLLPRLDTTLPGDSGGGSGRDVDGVRIGDGAGGDPGVGFADRAAGEAWLKTQDSMTLLLRSETLRDIGPAGWRQLRAAALPDDRGGLTPAAAAADLATVSTMTADSAAGRNLHSHGGQSHQDNDLVREQQEGAVANVAVVGSSSGLPAFTFFHHPETGEVRWSLSPRSALATPRTPRREASRARLVTCQQELQGSGRSGNDEDALAAGGSLSHSNSENDGWELVEDGDMVFYHNRKLGTSTWEPPPGWAEGGG